MPKLILRCNYLKNAPPSHLANYMNYISTREGVEKIDTSYGLLPATVKQKELIADILLKIEDADRMHEYYDYIQKPNRENATEFITQALENNLDIIAKKKNYIDYLANRPRVERIGTHGLFSNEGESIVLSRVAEEVANHPGVVWTNVISLRREDAERLGYDSAAQWQALLRSRMELLCNNYKIDSRNLKWYAAFHNESHHPHVHLVIYSQNPTEGYLTKNGIDAMRSTYANDIFRQEFMSIYEKKTLRRDQLKEQANESLLFLLHEIQGGVCHNEIIAVQMQLLSKRLMNTGGKKVYGYLKADVKAIINGIIDELEKDEKVADCYQKWLESQNEILHYYKDANAELIPLSQQKEFKSLKNMIIREALRYGNGYFYTEDEMMDAVDVDSSNADAKRNETMEEIEDVPLENRIEENDKDTGEFFFAKWTEKYQEARSYLHGNDEMEKDEEAAYEIMKEEALRGNVFAIHDFGKLYTQGIFVDADLEAANNWYKKALTGMITIESENEDAYLEYRIGKMYQYGLGTGEDISEAIRWFAKASEKKHKYAMYSLGMLYLHGMGVEQDDRKAYQLFLQSHESGNAYASMELGKLYEGGRGTEKNVQLAEACYRSAFFCFLHMEKKSKDDRLCYRIGMMYLQGLGTQIDVKKAEEYLLKSADDGNPNAQYQLAKLYLAEEYENIGQALKYLILAANQNHAFAAYRLGKLYLAGEEVEKNTEKAIAYLESSAHLGNQFAQYVLGKLYLTGRDVEKDLEKAYTYLSQSAEQGNVYAAFLLEHWNEIGQPDLFLMATRLMHHLERIIEEDVTGRRGVRSGGIDRKLAKKMKQKKIAQGHAADDREAMVHTQ